MCLPGLRLYPLILQEARPEVRSRERHFSVPRAGSPAGSNAAPLLMPFSFGFTGGRLSSFTFSLPLLVPPPLVAVQVKVRFPWRRSVTRTHPLLENS